MPAPVRFPSGVTSQKITQPLGQYVLPDPAKWYTYFNDFTSFAAAEWVVTETNAASTQAIIDAADGQLALAVVSTLDDQLNAIQLLNETFSITNGKRAVFRARLKLDEVLQSDMVAGIQIKDTTPLDVTDGIFFIKADGAATVDLLIEKDNVATTLASVATLVADTFIELAWELTPTAVKVYVDGVQVASTTVLTNLPNDEFLSLSFAVQNGDAVAAKTLTIDHVLAAVER